MLVFPAGLLLMRRRSATSDEHTGASASFSKPKDYGQSRYSSPRDWLPAMNTTAASRYSSTLHHPEVRVRPYSRPAPPARIKANGASPTPREKWWILDSESDLGVNALNGSRSDPLVLMGMGAGTAESSHVSPVSNSLFLDQGDSIETESNNENESEAEQPPALLYHQFLFGEVDLSIDVPESEPESLPPPFWNRHDPLDSTTGIYQSLIPPEIPPKSEARYSSSSVSTSTSSSKLTVSKPGHVSQAATLSSPGRSSPTTGHPIVSVDRASSSSGSSSESSLLNGSPILSKTSDTRYESWHQPLSNESPLSRPTPAIPSQKKALLALGIVSPDAVSLSREASNSSARQYTHQHDCHLPRDDNEDWSLQYHRLLVEQYQSSKLEQVHAKQSSDRVTSFAMARSQAGKSVVRSSGMMVDSLDERPGSGFGSASSAVWQYETVQLRTNRRDAQFRQEAAGIGTANIAANSVNQPLREHNLSAPRISNDTSSAASAAAFPPPMRLFSRSIFHHLPQRVRSQEKEKLAGMDKSADAGQRTGPFRRKLKSKNRNARRTGESSAGKKDASAVRPRSEQVGSTKAGDLKSHETGEMYSLTLPPSPPISPLMSHFYPHTDVSAATSYESLNSLNTERRMCMVEEVADSSSSGSIYLAPSQSVSATSINSTHTAQLVVELPTTPLLSTLPSLQAGVETEPQVETEASREEEFDSDLTVQSDSQDSDSESESESDLESDSESGLQEPLFDSTKVALIIEQIQGPAAMGSGGLFKRSKTPSGRGDKPPTSPRPEISSPVMASRDNIAAFNEQKFGSPSSPRLGSVSPSVPQQPGQFGAIDRAFTAPVHRGQGLSNSDQGHHHGGSRPVGSISPPMPMDPRTVRRGQGSHPGHMSPPPMTHRPLPNSPPRQPPPRTATAPPAQGLYRPPAPAPQHGYGQNRQQAGAYCPPPQAPHLPPSQFPSPPPSGRGVGYTGAQQQQGNQMYYQQPPGPSFQRRLQQMGESPSVKTSGLYQPPQGQPLRDQVSPLSPTHDGRGGAPYIRKNSRGQIDDGVSPV